MRIGTSLKRRDEMKGAVSSAFYSAKIWGQTSKELHTRVLGIKKWYNVPRWVSSYIDGYIDAKTDELYKRELYFGYLIKGKVYSVHRDMESYYEKHDITPRELCDQPCGHFWKESHNVYFTSDKELENWKGEK